MEQDPSLQGHYVEVHQLEMPLQVRIEHLSIEDHVMARIFKNQQAYKVELTSEVNVSFYYQAHLSQPALAQLTGESKSEIEWFRDIFSGQHRYELKLSSQSTALLVISQEQKYKHYELIRLEFELVEGQQLKRSIMYRYERMAAREKMLEGYWENMRSVISTKNPSLLLQFDHRHRKHAFK